MIGKVRRGSKDKERNGGLIWVLWLGMSQVVLSTLLVYDFFGKLIIKGVK